MRTKKPITIAGAGPAGLTTAINLAKAGYEVVVYEENSDVGLRHQGQIQGFENWVYGIDTLEWLQNLNIKQDFNYKAINNISLFSSDLKRYDFNSKLPIVYLIQRGNKENCFDYALKRQAEDLDVKIKFNTRVAFEEADIIATGPPKVTYMASGINFKTDVDDLRWLIFDDNLAPKGYGYFIVWNGQATIASFIKYNFKDSHKYLMKTINTFKKLINLKIDKEVHFSGIGYFNIHYNFPKIVVGEATGLQDYLLGFGIKFVMHSGYLATKSISDVEKYINLIKKEIYPFQKISIINRFLFEKLGDKGYKWLLEKSKKQEGKISFKEIYNQYNNLKNLLYPFIRAKYLLSGKF